MKFLCSAQRSGVTAPGLAGRRDGEKSKTENRKFAISAFETKEFGRKFDVHTGMPKETARRCADFAKPAEKVDET